MPQVTAIYIDFQCPFSYRLWCWLGLLQGRERVEVRPYSLDAGPADRGRATPWDEGQPSLGLELLALGEFAREAGTETHHAYIDAAFRRMHDHETDLSGLEAWLALGGQLGLNLDEFTADSERWRAEVGLWQQEAEDELGVFGTPTVVIDDEHGLYVKLPRDVVDAGAARRLLDDVLDLATQPVEEIRRTR